MSPDLTELPELVEDGAVCEAVETELRRLHRDPQLLRTGCRASITRARVDASQYVARPCSGRGKIEHSRKSAKASATPDVPSSTASRTDITPASAAMIASLAELLHHGSTVPAMYTLRQEDSQSGTASAPPGAPGRSSPGTRRSPRSETAPAPPGSTAAASAEHMTPHETHWLHATRDKKSTRGCVHCHGLISSVGTSSALRSSVGGYNHRPDAECARL